MKIISINAGSSSLKFKLFDMTTESVISSGLFERIGIDGSFYTIKYNNESIKEEIALPDHTEAIRILMDKLIALDIISSLEDIKGIGHRVVSGGEKYKDSVLVTDQVIEDIESLRDFAPIHNPQAAKVMRSFKEVLPTTPMVAIFDTTFHQTMEKEDYLYPVPYSWYEKYGVRKYGAHGTSYRFIAEELEKQIGRKDIKSIICHIGSGASISAVKDGKCVDTSMGFTPVTGIMMATRSGDIDPSIITYIMEKEGKNALEVLNDLNNNSGLIGVSGVSPDTRDVEKGISEGNERCKLALEMYVKRIVDYIAKYYVLLGGADVIAFTAGVGENNPNIRKSIIEKLSCLGIKVDEEANSIRGEIRKISSDDSSTLVYVIPTNEELVMARDTLRLVTNR